MKKVLTGLLILTLILSGCNAKTMASGVEGAGESASQQESSVMESKQVEAMENGQEESAAQEPVEFEQEELDVAGDFLMPIEDVFSITGRGVVVTGKIMRGNISINDEIEIVGMSGEVITTKVTGIESFRKLLDSAEAGDNVGLLINAAKENITRGQVAAKPGSICAYTNFKAVITPISDGQKTISDLEGFSAQFYIRTTDVTGVITSLEKISEDIAAITVIISVPMALEVDTQLVLRQNGRAIATGKVTEVLDAPEE